MILRDYQQEISDAVLKEWEERNSTLVVCPTGTGKTIIFADIIRRCQPRRALVLAHREELIFQARDKISRTTGLDCDIEMAELKAHGDNDLFHRAPVIVSTVQTQTAGGDGGGRMGKFDPAQFGLLIVDEAHHATSPSYRKVINYFRTNPALKVLGVTATPDRADEEALGQVFDSVAFDYEILEAINDGWLVPIEQQLVDVASLDFSQVRTTAGDLNGADLAAVMENEKNLHGIASASIEIIGDRRSLVFCSGVKHAETLAAIYNRHRPNMAAWVCGETEKSERRRILAEFAAGLIQVVCNCGVLTEGFDDPGVEVIIMGRPTKSRSLYSQMIGRSTRPLPGVVDGPETPELRKAAIDNSRKRECLVVDFVGNSGRHKLITSADVLGGKFSQVVLDRAVLAARKGGKPVRMADLIELTALQIEREEEERKRLAEEAAKTRLVAQATWTTQTISPFDVFQIRPGQSRGWDRDKVLSQKQCDLLAKHMGVNPDALPYVQGKQLLNELFHRWKNHLCTYKQAKVLKKFGYKPKTVTMAEARRLIDAIAANNWRRPPVPPMPTRQAA